MLAGWCACRSILKVYKQAMRSWSGPEEVAVVETKQSLVGKRLSDITTQRVIVGVLLMMFGLQLFELETYNMYDDTSLVKGGLHVLVDTYRSRTNMEQVRTSPPLLSLLSALWARTVPLRLGHSLLFLRGACCNRDESRTNLAEKAALEGLAGASGDGGV